jgi:hypothetical protein
MPAPHLLSAPQPDEEDPRLPVATSVQNDHFTTIIDSYQHPCPRFTAAEVEAARGVFVELAEHPDLLIRNYTDADYYVGRIMQLFNARATIAQLTDRYRRTATTAAQSLRSATRLADHISAARRFRVGWWTNEVYNLFSLPTRLHQFVSCSTFYDFVYSMSRAYVQYNHESLWLTPFYAEQRGAAMYEAYRYSARPFVIPHEDTHWEYDSYIYTFCEQLPTAGLFVTSESCVCLPVGRRHLAQNILHCLTYNEVRFLFAIAYAYHAARLGALHTTAADGMLRFLSHHVHTRRALHTAGDHVAAAASDRILDPGWCADSTVVCAFNGFAWLAHAAGTP